MTSEADEVWRLLAECERTEPAIHNRLESTRAIEDETERNDEAKRLLTAIWQGLEDDS